VVRFLFLCGLVKPARLRMLPKVLAAAHTSNHDDCLMCTETRDGFEHCALGRGIERRGRCAKNKRCGFSHERPVYGQSLAFPSR
jgi:hypothetical protein